MNDELHYVTGQLLDALWRGICIAASIAIIWPCAVLIARKTPAVLKALGVW